MVREYWIVSLRKKFLFQYAIDVIKEWGSLKGSVLALKRILRCHPWSESGYDPIPRKKGKK